jgi:hypothetical protein
MTIQYFSTCHDIDAFSQRAGHMGNNAVELVAACIAMDGTCFFYLFLATKYSVRA